ncbi:nucleotide synthetase [Brevundimonas sp. R86498]|uniref:nucleotide synthetase n=1 Tax=Brevundimonas sp. R86498 TaxID=3093845 RepID=UPI0037CBDABF
MTDAEELEQEDTDLPLPERTGQGFQPEEIVYALYRYDSTKPEGRRVSAARRGFVVEDTDIASFVDARVARLPLPEHVHTRRPHPRDPKPDRPLNIYVGRPCWVVIQLDSDVEWYFAPKQPGITTRADYGDANCDLEHVMPNGDRAGPLGPTTIGCRLIYFRVQRRGDRQHQRFRCHIALESKRLIDPDAVDPDIPNDGGRFPFPLIEKGDPGDTDV